MQYFNFVVAAAGALLGMVGLSEARYEDTCVGVTLFGQSHLFASCMGNDGNAHYANLDLNNCIGNYNGIIGCTHQNGAYEGTCHSCELDWASDIHDMILYCWCKNDRGGENFSALDLNQCIWNKNSQLQCF